MDLYSTFAQDFSDSRQSPWKGWDHLVQYFHQTQPLKLLDIGCGNGRFLKFLVEEKIEVEDYLGIDNSTELLQMADQFMHNVQQNSRISTFKLENVDLNEAAWGEKITDKFNLIVAFGLMHHIESFYARTRIYAECYDKLLPGGLFIVTYWQFAKFKRYESKLTKLEGENDYEMTFGDNGAKRFCHYADDAEITKLENAAKFERLESFYKDGKEDNQNLYVIYKKI